MAEKEKIVQSYKIETRYPFQLFVSYLSNTKRKCRRENNLLGRTSKTARYFLEPNHFPATSQPASFTLCPKRWIQDRQRRCPCCRQTSAAGGSVRPRGTATPHYSLRLMSAVSRCARGSSRRVRRIGPEALARSACWRTLCLLRGG